MRASSQIHEMWCSCGECKAEALRDDMLPARMTLLGLLISGIIIAISETVRHFDAIIAAVLP